MEVVAQTFTIEQWCCEIAELLGHPIFRHINVTVHPHTKKKIPTGEKNNMTIQEIIADSGNVMGNSISLFIKYTSYEDVPMYVADFERKGIPCALLCPRLAQRA
jgi:hypothetical protein